MRDAIEEEFAPVDDSIGWADGAIGELDMLIKAFFRGEVASLITEVDRATGEYVRKLKFTAHIPKDFRRKATEALNCARHSFDQSVFAARNVLSQRSRQSVYYPWSNSPTDLERLLQARAVDARLWDTLRAHQPYSTSKEYAGGNDLIRTLASIANNKHTVGLTVDGVMLGVKLPPMRGHFIEAMFGSPKWDTRKREAEILRWRGQVEMQGDYTFEFIICLKDPRLVHPVDVIGALSEFTSKAKLVRDTLKAKCEELTT